MEKRNNRKERYECWGLTKKNMIVIAFVMMALIITGGWGVAGGYLPIVLKEIPLPDSREISIEQAQEDLPDYINDLLRNMPHQKDLLIRVYHSTNMTSSQILTFYCSQMENTGFQCTKNGKLYLDKKTGYLSAGHHPGYEFVEFYAFQKGLNVVAIVIVYDSDNQMDCTTFFVAGNIWDFRDVAAWLRTL